jgi:hypothetical protein
MAGNATHTLNGTTEFDEYYTPRVLVDALRPYLTRYLKHHLFEDDAGRYRKPIFWCPFDLETSEFVFTLREFGDVIHSHIDEGRDFFRYQPDEFDIVISNPPFSKKLDVFKRLDYLQKPWAMIVTMMCVNYQEIAHYFAEHPQIQLLIPDKRISYDGNGVSFSSGYVCRNLLDRDLIFCQVPHGNQGKQYVPSRMYGEKRCLREQSSLINMDALRS